MPVMLVFGLAVICLSGIGQGLYFAARSERTACKIMSLVMLSPGSHCRELSLTFSSLTRTLKEVLGSTESGGGMEEKILFSPVAKGCFQGWELELILGRSRKLHHGGVGLPCSGREVASAVLLDPSFQP